MTSCISNKFAVLSLTLAHMPAGVIPPKVSYKIYGENHLETVILIHGFNSSQVTWKQLAESLSKKYRVITFDQPGHGLSPADGTDYSPEKLAHILKGLVDFLMVEKAHIIGHSMGGRSALMFASLYPEKTSSLIIEDMDLRQNREFESRIPDLLKQYEPVRWTIPDVFGNLQHPKLRYQNSTRLQTSCGFCLYLKHWMMARSGLVIVLKSPDFIWRRDSPWI